jgi:predicted NBD/HSP70 family sugar kinase/transcriptional regulator with XRE-family HTH domain
MGCETRGGAREVRMSVMQGQQLRRSERRTCAAVAHRRRAAARRSPCRFHRSQWLYDSSRGLTHRRSAIRCTTLDRKPPIFHVVKETALAGKSSSAESSPSSGTEPSPFDPDFDGLAQLKADVEADPLALAAYHDAARRNALAEALQQGREDAGQTQGDVATAMGTTQSAVSELERGRGGEPKLQTMQRYARAVDRRLDVAVVDARWPVYDEQMAERLWRTLERMILSPLLTALATERKRDRTRKNLAQVIEVDEAVVDYLIESLRTRGWVTTDTADDVEVYSLGEKAAHMIGISLKPDAVSGVVTDLHGKIVRRGEVALNDTSYRSVLNASVDMVRQLYAQRDAHIVAGVGVSVSGVVSADTGNIKFAPELADASLGDSALWHNVPFEDDLQAAVRADLKEQDLRVIVENDTNALAVHQYLEHAAAYGRDRESAITVVLLTGGGVGAAFVYGGHIIHGANSAAGEGGHVIVDPDGMPCRSILGHRGCLETVASAQGILQQLDIPFDPKSDLRRALAQLNQRAAAGDEAVVGALHYAGYTLGRFLGGVISTNDPGRLTIYAHEELVDTSFAAAEQFRLATYAGIDAYASKDDGVERGTEVDWKPIKQYLYATAAASRVKRQFLYSPEQWIPEITAVKRVSPTTVAAAHSNNL